jgi:hypothetical protein
MDKGQGGKGLGERGKGKKGNLIHFAGVVPMVSSTMHLGRVEGRKEGRGKGKEGMK